MAKVGTNQILWNFAEMDSILDTNSLRILEKRRKDYSPGGGGCDYRVAKIVDGLLSLCRRNMRGYCYKLF